MCAGGWGLALDEAARWFSKALVWCLLLDLSELVQVLVRGLVLWTIGSSALSRLWDSASFFLLYILLWNCSWRVTPPPSKGLPQACPKLCLKPRWRSWHCSPEEPSSLGGGLLFREIHVSRPILRRVNPWRPKGAELFWGQVGS